MTSAVPSTRDSVGVAEIVDATLHYMFWPYLDGAPIYRFVNDAVWLNHSCQPNAEAGWHAETERLEVRAITDIEEGEEITIAYTSVYQPANARWRTLTFSCNCLVCQSRWPDLKLFRARERKLKFLAAGFERLRAYRRTYPYEASALTSDVVETMWMDPETHEVLTLLAELSPAMDEHQAGMTSEGCI